MTTEVAHHLEPLVVSGFEEASAVLRSPGWSSDPIGGVGPLAAIDLPPGLVLFMDPPDHTRLRRLLSPAFTPRAIERLRPRIATIIEAALDALEDEDEADLVDDLAYLIPMAVVAELMDVGEEGAGLFLDQTPRLAQMLEVDAGPAEFAVSAEASAELMMFLVPLMAERRKRPGDDFISALLTLEGDDGLAMEEVLATCVLLLGAGHETTANLIGSGALALTRQPEQRPLLAADPARAVEELLRAESPVKLAGRIALTDHEVGGLRVEAGRQVLVRIDEANRDPRRFPDPDRLDLGREPIGHLAFGGGVHFCLGAALARVETAETLVRLFARFPDLALATEEIRWRESSTFHGLSELPVRLRS